MLLREIKNIFHKELDPIYAKGEVDSFFYLLIEHYLGLERFILAVQPNWSLTKQAEQPLFEALAELRSERPVQYIIGNAEFMGMDFKVDENVLIPRPETEELVRWILEDAFPDVTTMREDSTNEPFTVLDIGTGSGCIAVSLAKNLPDAEVSAMDVSSKALEIARTNASDHEADILFMEADILEWDGPGTKLDLIVSNPPYVREREKEDMRRNVIDYEPGLALFVSDKNPLTYYDAITHFAQHNLRDGGTLYLEINQYLAQETERLLKKYNFADIELRNDMFGNDRMIKCRKKPS